MFILREMQMTHIYLCIYRLIYVPTIIIPEMVLSKKKKIYSSQQYFCQLIYKDSPSIFQMAILCSCFHFDYEKVEKHFPFVMFFDVTLKRSIVLEVFC